MKIIKMTEKVPQVVILPDGIYEGIWGGYIIEVKAFDKIYELHTEDGVKGFNIKVMVTIKNGEATFDTLKN